MAAPVGSSDPLGPEIGTSHGYSAVGLPWTNPCGSARPSIGARAYLHRTYHLREMTVNDRDMGWSYAIRVSLPDEPGGPLDCVEVMDVQYFVLSSHLQYRPPQEISFAVTGSLYAALFNRSSHILSAEPVERDGVKAGEVVFYVPRVIREDLTIHHQAAALVYDVNGGVLACILTSNGVSLVAPSTTGGIDPR